MSTVGCAELRRHRLAEADLRQAVRSSGCGSMTSVAIAVLETNGSISVITRDRLADGTALVGLADDE